MFDLAKLVGIEIKGQFLRNPEGVENSIKSLEASLEDYSPEEAKQKRIEIERSGKPYDFSLRVFYANFSTGLFVAGCKDDFGIAGVLGLIKPPEGIYAGTIAFQKSYPRGENSFLGRGGERAERIFKDNLRQIFYSGQHWLNSENAFGAEGEYLSDGLNYLGGGGTWKMSAKISH